MPSAGIKRVALVVGFVGLSLGGWLATRGGPTVDAIGGTWAIEEAVWHDADGALRATVTFAPKAVRLVNAPRLDVLDSLCAAALANAATLGREDVDAADIYRLDMNVLSDDGTAVFEAAVPIPVDGARCVLDLFGETFFPTYPAPLDGWYLSGTGMMTAGDGGAIPAVRFQNRPDGDVDLAGFDMQAACQFVLEDVSAWRGLGGAVPQDGQIRIEARNVATLGSLAAAGLYQAEELTIAGGICLGEGSST